MTLPYYIGLGISNDGFRDVLKNKNPAEKTARAAQAE